MTTKLVTLIAVLFVATSACGGSGGSGACSADPAPVAVGPAEADRGDNVYNSICVACHGTGGEGIRGNGKPLVENEFVAGMTDDDLASFVKQGRDAGHADNTTGIDMPPCGGNDDLTEQDIVDVVAYLRSL
ncbi:MAG: cytochrome c [bacterium]|nr:cytochrome c [bacterium]